MALLRFFKWLFILREPLTRTPRTHSTTPWNILKKKNTLSYVFPAFNFIFRFIFKFHTATSQCNHAKTHTRYYIFFLNKISRFRIRSTKQFHFLDAPISKTPWAFSTIVQTSKSRQTPRSFSREKSA